LLLSSERFDTSLRQTRCNENAAKVALPARPKERNLTTKAKRHEADTKKKQVTFSS
jgi:hypothetical protein